MQKGHPLIISETNPIKEALFMTIKKILAVLLCVAMLAVSFAGCGNDPAPKGDDEYEIAVVVKILGISYQSFP